MLLAHVRLGGLQALLGCALGGEFVAHANDAGGLAGVALLELVNELCVPLGFRLGGLVLLVGGPEQQGEGAEQGQAVEGLAEGGQAATFICPPQPQPACRS